MRDAVIALSVCLALSVATNITLCIVLEGITKKPESIRNQTANKMESNDNE